MPISYGATQIIATWTTSLQADSIPPSVYKAATRSFYNWVGCAIGGSGHETTRKVIQALRPLLSSTSQASASSILGKASQELLHQAKTDPQHAALINGIASHVHDYDDTHLDTIIHPTGPVASALLAYAEYASSIPAVATSGPAAALSGIATGLISGQNFMTALIAGIEVECLLGLSVWPTHYDVGWHITSTVGSIGAAVAVAKAMALPPEQVRHAIGIAASQVTGLREMFGTDTKPFHVGRAAQNGLLAAILAQGGFTASENALEGKRGWVSVVGHETDRLDEMIERLGRGDETGRWEIEKNAFKPFPCGIVVHPVIDACIQLHDEFENNPEVDVNKHLKRVHAQVHPLMLELTGKKSPVDGLQAKFSVYHGGAIGLVLGKATPNEYETSVVLDDRIINIRDKIEAQIKRDVEPDEAIVTVEMHDGTIYEKHVKHALGSLENPMTDQQLEEKFLNQVSIVLGVEEAKRASKACWNLMSVSDIREITWMCHG